MSSAMRRSYSLVLDRCAVGQGEPQIGAGELAVRVVERGLHDLGHDVGEGPLPLECLAAFLAQGLTDTLKQGLQARHDTASGPGLAQPVADLRDGWSLRPIMRGHKGERLAETTTHCPLTDRSTATESHLAKRYCADLPTSVVWVRNCIRESPWLGWTARPRPRRSRCPRIPGDSMSIDVPCPACGARLKAPEIKAGKKARCGKCGEKFRIPSAGEHTPSGTPVPTGEGELAPMAGDVDEFEVLPATSNPGRPSPTLPAAAATSTPQPKARSSCASRLPCNVEVQ